MFDLIASGMIVLMLLIHLVGGRVQDHAIRKRASQPTHPDETEGESELPPRG